MDQATQQNAAMVEQSTAATHALAAEIGRIVGMILQFATDRTDARVSGTGSGAPGRRSAA